MYLEKIEIQGFKSFAKKTTLKFIENKKKEDKPSVGLTVIVGPNGSGKSNIADAVRWVLGEQSSKLLRGKKGEDVIFSGSSKKASLSFAEVSLYLNNENSAQGRQGRQAPIDYRELVITRRLYRDGESEYLINNSKVRLLDVSMLLAKAKFSQRAYSVVGQGMVDSFLNTTPIERKDFFDEATGVKMYQIKKHDAINKLNNARNNLEQAEQLLAEIEPRMRSLTRQIKKLEQRREVEKELVDLQKNYYAQKWHKLSHELKKINSQVIEYEKEQRQQEKELAKINNELSERERKQYQSESKEKLERELKELRQEHGLVAQKLAEIRAHQNISLELAGKTDVAWLSKKADQLKEEINKAEKELSIAGQEKIEANKNVVVIRKEQNIIDEKIINLRQKIISYRSNDSGDASGILQRVKRRLKELLELNNKIDQALDKGDNKLIKKQFGILREKINELKNISHQKEVKDDADLEKLNSDIITMEEEKNRLTEKYIETQGGANSAQNSLDYLMTAIKTKQAELRSIEEKLVKRQDDKKSPDKELVGQEKELQVDLEQLDHKVDKAENQLKEINNQERQQRDEIISLQKKAHQLQNEYNELTNSLSEVRVAKARVETKLEDLEQEIRSETNNLRAIMDNTNHKQIDNGEAREKISKFKRQLELIGGIDPEIQAEYEETKERYEFLSKQSTDLRSAINSLEKVIVSLEKTITERFDKSFEQISKQFEKYFKVLFDGGNVKLEKVYEEASRSKNLLEVRSENDDESEGAEEVQGLKSKVKSEKKIVLRETKKVLVGIDVSATPPNKKIKSISMLSGGERALTSIALISAIISVNPSPFVILDEVDAALDEANSIRLGRILADLSKKTQFISITHNRTIMYKADIIYGVTMGNDGVSKLLSVKVDDLKGARR